MEERQQPFPQSLKILWGRRAQLPPDTLSEELRNLQERSARLSAGGKREGRTRKQETAHRTSGSRRTGDTQTGKARDWMNIRIMILILMETGQGSPVSPMQEVDSDHQRLMSEVGQREEQHRKSMERMESDEGW